MPSLCCPNAPRRLGRRHKRAVADPIAQLPHLIAVIAVFPAQRFNERQNYLSLPQRPLKLLYSCFGGLGSGVQFPHSLCALIGKIGLTFTLSVRFYRSGLSSLYTGYKGLGSGGGHEGEDGVGSSEASF